MKNIFYKKLIILKKNIDYFCILTYNIKLVIIYNILKINGPLAQRLEQTTHNRWVAGSNPAGAIN